MIRLRREPYRRRRFNESGQMAGIEVIPFGFLILVVGALLLANAWAVVDAKLAVSAAAREGARAFVEASSEAEAHHSAQGAAATSIAGHGHDSQRLAVTIITAGQFGRCVRVSVEASIEVASVNLPFIGGFGRRFNVGSTHHEVVDPYRSGLEGEASCDA